MTTGWLRGVGLSQIYCDANDASGKDNRDDENRYPKLLGWPNFVLHVFFCRERRRNIQERLKESELGFVIQVPSNMFESKHKNLL